MAMRLPGLLLGILALVQGASAQVQIQIPSLPREARAMWVATVSNIDWPTASNRTPSQQRAEAVALLDLAVNLKFNIIVLQVRPQADAIYPSPFDPWTPFLTGTMGTAPSDGYDPLQFWIEESHRRGLELHAWINPYRALSNANSSTSPSHITQTHPGVVKTYGTAKWIDPGHPFAPERTLSVVADLVTQYDLDGIHLDDYFYPYPISGTPFPDEDTYGVYQAQGGTLSLANWRRQNVDNLIERMYATVKLRKPWVKVGISPFGIWRPGNPPGITGLDSYASIYADSKKWLNNGWLDYISPQLYWRISSSGQPYEKLLTWWVQQNHARRHVWPGNYTSNVSASYGNWPAQEIIDQILLTRQQLGSTGNVHFSARALRGNWKGISDLLRSTYRELALVPASPWLDARPPEPARVTARERVSGTMSLFWSRNEDDPPARYVLSTRVNLKWNHQMLPGTATSVNVPTQGLSAVGIRAIDRAGNESEPTVLYPGR